MKPQAMLRIDLQGSPANMTKAIEFLRETAAFMVEHSAEMSDRFKVRLFLDESFGVKQSVSVPQKGYKVEGSVF